MLPFRNHYYFLSHAGDNRLIQAQSAGFDSFHIVQSYRFLA